MSVPTDEELESCRDTLEWLVANCEALEPSATNTIATWREAAETIPTDEELEDHE